MVMNLSETYKFFTLLDFFCDRFANARILKSKRQGHTVEHVKLTKETQL